jgi:hypothetical protein
MTAYGNFDYKINQIVHEGKIEAVKWNNGEN